MRAFTIIAAIVALALGVFLLPRGEAVSDSGPDAGPIAASDAWVRQPILPGRPGALYLVITNSGEKPDRLVRVSSADVGWAELHTHTHEDGVMRMRRVEAIGIPPHGTVTLAPGGFHVMLFETAESVVSGGQMTFTLHFEHADPIKVDAGIRALDSQRH